MDERPQLTPSEERIIEFLRKGTLDAEIAVRLGLSVGETKEKIDRLRRRLGLEDRRALAGWQPRDSPGSEATDWSRHGGQSRAQDAVEIDAGPLIDFTGRQPKRHSRRAVLGIAGAGAVVVAGGGAAVAAWLRAGREDGWPPPEVVESAMETARADGATQLAQTSPTPEPHPGLSAIKEDPTAWLRAKLPNGGVIPFQHGVGFIDTETGVIDVMQLDLGAGEQFAYGYRVSSSGRLVAAEMPYGPGKPKAGLLDRASGQAWSWDPALLGLLLLDEEFLLFSALRGDPSYGNAPHPIGKGYLVRPDMEPLLEFDLGLSLPGSVGYAAISKDHGAIISVSGIGDRLVIIDTVAARATDAEQPGDNNLAHVYAVRAGTDPGTVTAFFGLTGASEGKDAMEVTYDLSGRILSAARVASSSAWDRQDALPSPDGRWILAPGTLRSRYWALGDNEDWVYTDLLETKTGEPRFRVLSGNLNYGFGSYRRWLADSSSFLVEGAGLDAPLESHASWRTGRQIYTVSPEGVLDPLPRAPRGIESLESNDGYNAESYFAYWGGYEPAPDNPDLFAVGRLAVYNRRTDEWFAPGNFVQPIENDPWGESSAELRFVFPPGGRDGAGPGTVLVPAIEYPPFRSEVTLQVTRAGDCLNLRDRPRVDATILDCLSDGTRVTVVEPAYELRGSDGTLVQSDEGRPAFWSEDVGPQYQMYVHVRAPSGQAGWVAIQYLDWA